MRRFAVSESKARELELRLEALGIGDDQVRESFVKASGPGGQNVNKSNTAVRLKHLPSGIEVKVGRSRSQGLNRFLAWRELVERLEARRSGEPSVRTIGAAKARKQKARRARRQRSKSSGKE